MSIDEVLITVLPGDRRAAALADGQLLRLAVAGDDEIRVGDIILGRIKKVAASIGCAFVDLGREPHGILMRNDASGEQRLSEGQDILCQVLREAVGEKGPKLTARLTALPETVRESLAGARPPSRLARGPDPILSLLRDAVAAGVGRVIVDDGVELSRIRGALPELADRLEAWLEPAPLFAAYGVDDAIDRALARMVPLRSGGRLTIEETEALAVIDVDIGGTSGSSPRLGGAGMRPGGGGGDRAGDRDPRPRRHHHDRLRPAPPPDRAGTGAYALRSSLAGDDRQVRVAGWTRLGLVEMSRERRGPSLAGRLTVDCASCGGHGREISACWVAGDALRAMLAEARRAPAAPPSLVASPAVLEQLRGPLAQALAEIERKLGVKIALVEADVRPAEAFHARERPAGAEPG